ncbi:MAG: UDP-glucose/GDP-mannose dehydrogenase family protein, partial [Candidatus Eremiobacteraeota bacterium]|nr:UDP-glucose/GDP-mannose dehydrogenase family protein [Candidatus Eremiobacteraeota bacterium]
VTAACLAERYDVIAYEPNTTTLSALEAGRPPIFEPGLAELIAVGRRENRLHFSDSAAALGDAAVVWITYDTPLDEADRVDADAVERSILDLLPVIRKDALVIISSQVPVGFTRRIETLASEAGRADIFFAYIPENLRLGQSLHAFRHPQRVVVGIRENRDRQRIAELMKPFCSSLLWMSVESAEMTKHALNAFLATSVTFANEIAGLAERCGADYREIQRGLQSDERIGEQSYLAAGLGFGGGTLARDVSTLIDLGIATGYSTNLLEGVTATNVRQRRWALDCLHEELGQLRGRRIAILGLTYKTGTNTLRRSIALDIARQLVREGATVAAHDPAVTDLGADAARIALVSLEEALRNAEAVVVGTEWPQFREHAPRALGLMKRLVVVDPKRFLEDLVPRGTIYRAVGLRGLLNLR